MPEPIPLPLNSITMVSIFSRLAEQRVINTFHYQFEGTPDPDVDYRDYYASLGAALLDPLGLVGAYLPCCPTDMFVETLRIQTIWPIRQRYVKTVIGSAGTATGGAAKTANVAMSIRRVSDTIGPQGVGRIQIPLAQDWQVDGYVDSAAGLAADPLAALMTLPVLGTLEPSTWNPVLFGVTASVAHTSLIIDASLEETVRVMRRRTVRLGE